MPLIFKHGSQSRWEQSTNGTNCFLRDGDPFLHQYCPKSLYSWVGRGAGFGLQDWTDEEIQKGKVRAPCRPDFLAYEWGYFPRNLGLDDLGSVRRRSVLLQRPGNFLEVLLGPGQQATHQHVGDVALEVQFDSRGHKKQREAPGFCDGRPNHDRLRILASGDDPFLCGWRGSPNSVILLAYHLLDVEFLLVREHEVWQRAIDHFLENFPTFLGPHGHMIGHKLPGMQHLKGLHLQIVPQHLVHGDLLTPAAVAKDLQLRRGFRRSFPSCFWGVEGSGHSVFLSALVGQECFRSPVTSLRSSTPVNDSYPAVLQFQHYFFHFCEA